jgi:hypothetical protein
VIKLQRDFNRVVEFKTRCHGRRIGRTTRNSWKVAPKAGRGGRAGELNMHGAARATAGRSSLHAKSERLAVAMRENMVFICKPAAISADGKLFVRGDPLLLLNGGAVGKSARTSGCKRLAPASRSKVQAEPLPFLGMQMEGSDVKPHISS